MSNLSYFNHEKYLRNRRVQLPIALKYVKVKNIKLA